MTWHVLIDGEQRGPLEAETVARLIGRGEVNADSLVWTAGMQDWTRAIDVPEFAGKFDGAPPAPQPLRYGSEFADDDEDGAPGRLKIGRVFTDAFKGLAARPGNTLLITGVYAGLSVIVSIPMYIVILPKLGTIAASPDDFDMSVFGGIDIAVYFLMSIIGVALYGGLCATLVDLNRGHDVSVIRLLAGFPRIVPLILFSIVFSLLTVVGFALLVIPGVFVFAAMMPGIFIVMDRNVGPIAATKESFRATMKLGWFRMVALLLLSFAVIVGISMVYGLIAGFGAGLYGVLSAAGGANTGTFGPNVTLTIIQTVFMSAVMVVFLSLHAAVYKQAEPHLDAQ